HGLGRQTVEVGRLGTAAAVGAHVIASQRVTEDENHIQGGPPARRTAGRSCFKGATMASVGVSPTIPEPESLTISAARSSMSLRSRTQRAARRAQPGMRLDVLPPSRCVLRDPAPRL